MVNSNGANLKADLEGTAKIESSLPRSCLPIEHIEKISLCSERNVKMADMTTDNSPKMSVDTFEDARASKFQTVQ